MQRIEIISKEKVRRLQLLTERQNSLNELKFILDIDSDALLINRINIDLERIELDISKWWDDVLNKYSQCDTIGSNFEVNFITGELFKREILG